MTGRDSEDNPVQEGEGFVHKFNEEDGSSLGIPNILMDIQLRNSEDSEWVTVGHLLPDWKDWMPTHLGQLTSISSIFLVRFSSPSTMAI